MPDYEDSLGEQNTFDGGEPDSDREPLSLSDEATFGGDNGSADDAFDDGMEVVDLDVRYTIESVLGKGGMGEVLLATDTRLNRKVAIKRILGSAARSKTAVSRFLTEAQSIAALNHPNIVQIFDYGRAKDGPFLIMEFVEGSSLLEKCHQGPVPLDEAVDVICQVCQGLTKAHAANIVHRDIKPANVLLTEDGVPKLTDFGLAKDAAADTGMTMAGAVLGTLDFMPPEQRKDATLTDHRSDLWSLAATLYQMVTGEPPRVIDLDEVPSELRKCIAQALKSKKEDRFQTAVELGDALRGCLIAPPAAEQATVDLGAGECPACHARNDAKRKFCNGCGSTLRMTCLSCDAEIPVWEKFCGECGGNQQGLLDQKIAEYDLERNKCESLSGEYHFDESKAIASQLSSLEDERFSAVRDWGIGFAQEVEANRQRAHEDRQLHFNDAKLHRKAFDYGAAIHSMELIPSVLHTQAMKTYLDTLISDRDESDQLLVSVKEAISKRALENLLPQVERAIELRGDREDLPKLRTQLLKRQSKRKQQIVGLFDQANELESSGNARKAFLLLRKVEDKFLNKEQLAEKQRIAELKAAEESLVRVVQEANEDGVVEPHEVWLILHAVSGIKSASGGRPHLVADKLLKELASRIKGNPTVHANHISDPDRLEASCVLLGPHVSVAVINVLSERLREIYRDRLPNTRTAWGTTKNADRGNHVAKRGQSRGNTQGGKWYTCETCGAKMKAKNRSRHEGRCGRIAGVTH